MYVNSLFGKIVEMKGLTTLALDDNLIVTSANMKVGAYTIAAQPLVPSRLVVTVTKAGAEDTMGTITFVGTDYAGNAITEAVVPDGDAAVYTTNYFATVTSATGAGWVIGEGNDTVIIGVGDTGKIRVGGRAISFFDVSGNIWVRDGALAAEDATSFKMIATNRFDAIISDYLSITTDGTGGTFQYIIWES